MSYYYGLRGWIEVVADHEQQLLNLLRILTNKDEENNPGPELSGGWCWKPGASSWSQYAFFGKDVQDSGLAEFHTTLVWICSHKMQTDGIFHAQGEDGEKNRLIIIENDTLRTEVNAACILPI